MPVPLLDTNAQNLPLETELTGAFRRVLRSGRFILGQEVESFEQEVANLSSVAHCVGTSSGTDAILLALMALDIGPGDEVLVPTFTFFATAGCVSRTGATPVFVDACPVCFNIDIDDATAKLTSHTRAIIPVHLFGQCAEMDPILELAADRGLFVIEDAAQAIGATYRGKPAGSMGHFGTFSFFPSKNLGGLGDGGALVCNDPKLAHRSTILRNHGAEPKYHHHLIGGNFRLDALQAALLRVKLARYPSYNAARQANASRYSTTLSRLPGASQSDPAHCCCQTSQQDLFEASNTRLVLPSAYPHNGHIWNQYTLRVLGDGQRDALKSHLDQLAIGSEIYYPITLDQQACFATTPPASRVGCHTAHQLAKEVLSIPIFPELTSSQQDEVIAAIASFLQR
jgi:dTDP-4-amino-4,6-dideoxygalactose transaminase